MGHDTLGCLLTLAVQVPCLLRKQMSAAAFLGVRVFAASRPRVSGAASMSCVFAERPRIKSLSAALQHSFLHAVKHLCLHVCVCVCVCVTEVEESFMTSDALSTQGYCRASIVESVLLSFSHFVCCDLEFRCGNRKAAGIRWLPGCIFCEQGNSIAFRIAI